MRNRPHWNRRRRLAHLPAMYDDRMFAEAGGLMSYGTLIEDLVAVPVLTWTKFSKAPIPLTFQWSS